MTRGSVSWGSRLLLPALVVATFLIAAHARAQIAGQVGGTPASTPAPATQFFSNPEVHLTYEYPAELKAQDGAFAAAIARRMIYGEDAETDYAKARDCAKVLLSVGTGREGSPGPWVRVALVEIGELCAPAKVLQNKKAAQALLANLVKQGTTVMGMMPVERPTVYQIQGHWAAFCAAQGTPVTGQDLQTGQEQLIGVAAVAVDAKILGWVIQTSDAATFNRLLATGVDFGTGKPERLFAGAVQ